METVNTILNKIVENGSYEMVGIEYHDHIIFFGDLKKRKKNVRLLFNGM